MKSIIYLLFLIFLPLTAKAEPSKLISKLMETPASAFDVYLFNLYSENKCFFYEFSIEQEWCVMDVNYDFEDNLIVVYSMISEEHELLSGIDIFKLSEEDRNNKLNAIVTDASINFGVNNPDGEIYSVRIRNGWTNKQFDDTEIKNEIAKRTVIKAAIISEDVAHTVTRTHKGEYIYESFDRGN